MNIIQWLADVTDKGCRALSIVLLMSMTVVFFTQICLRYLFGGGLYWAEEMTRFMMVWLIYICSVAVFRESSHISVNALEDILPEKIKKYLKILQQLVYIVIFAMVGYLGYKILPFAMVQKSPNIQIPMVYLYSIFPITSGLMILQLIANILLDLRNKS